ncbi:MAG TPA: fatty acid desaturase family protein [Luteimonas sp.]|nr:fatty acid desaturase family protein [Luteimonas sp.]
MKPIARKHKFDRSILDDAERLCGLDNWHAPAALIADYAVIAAAIAAVYVIGWVAYPFSIVLIGSRQRALATMVHEASHGTLARSRWMAGAIATVFSGYLIFTTLSAYRVSHVAGHHGRFGDPDLDADYKYMLEKGVYETGERRRYAWKTLIKPLLLGNVPSYLAYIVKARTFSDAHRHSRLENVALCVYWALILGCAFAFDQVFNLLLFWIVPFLTTYQIIGWFIELAEHAPLMGNAVDLQRTRNRHSHWLEHFLTGMHGESYHLAHHLRPRVPFWRMKQLHRILLRDPDYARWDSQCGGILFSSNGAPTVVSALIARSGPPDGPARPAENAAPG